MHGVPHKPTDETRAKVSALTSFGIPQENIAKYLEIDPKTLRKHYRRELDTGQLEANFQVGSFLHSYASGRALEKGATHADCVRAAMFWGKTRMGLRETNKIEHTSPDGSMSPGRSLSDFYQDAAATGGPGEDAEDLPEKI